MSSFWHSSKGMKNLAAGLLALALAGIATVHFASQKMIAIQGPGTLRAVDDQAVWLGVNNELWILDAAGHKTSQRTSSQLGLTAAVSNIALAPDGQALLTDRSDTAWQVVNTADLSRVRTIRPQWPPGFSDNYRRAIHIAVSPDWNIAVGTGGGHAVLLFDRDGKFKAQTAPGTFYFTNGLWHGPRGWWTTDTNRATLRLLDTETLAVKESIELKGELGGYSALGELVPSRGAPLADTQAVPVATVSRLGFLMTPGYAADVFADGRQTTFNKEPFAQLRDMDWFNKSLLIVDGGTYQVFRFGADRSSLGRFGDEEVNRALQRMNEERMFWTTLSSRQAFLTAAVMLLAGIAAYGRHKKLAVLAVTAARSTGRPAGGGSFQGLLRLVWQRLWIFGLPVVLRLLAFWAGLRFLLPWLMAGRGSPAGLGDALLILELALLSVLVPVLPVAMWQQWRHTRLTRKAAYEATLNHKARVWLDRHDDWDRVREPNESPRETLYLPGFKARWLLITNQRVLLFAASARERRLRNEWACHSVVVAGPPNEVPGGRASAKWRRILLCQPNLAVTFANGERLVVRCASAVTAGRAAEMLMQTRRMVSQAAPVTPATTRRPKERRRRWREVFASLAVPGLGQWMQDRFVTGTVLFTAGALLFLLVAGPVLWAAYGPKMHVGFLNKAYALFWWVVLAMVAAADAFHFSDSKRR